MRSKKVFISGASIAGPTLAYRDMRAALVSRLEALDAQKELALGSENND